MKSYPHRLADQNLVDHYSTTIKRRRTLTKRKMYKILLQKIK